MDRWGRGWRGYLSRKKLLDRRIYNTDDSGATDNIWHLKVAGVPRDSGCLAAEPDPSLLFLKTRPEEGDFSGGSAAPHFPHSSRWVRDTGGNHCHDSGFNLETLALRW